MALEGCSGMLYVCGWENGYVESLHSKVRDESLNREDFESERQGDRMVGSGRRKEQDKMPAQFPGRDNTPTIFGDLCEACGLSKRIAGSLSQ